MQSRGESNVLIASTIGEVESSTAESDGLPAWALRPDQESGTDGLGAFFSRILLAVDYAPGFEALAADADPVTRYAAFVGNTMDRYRASPVLRSEQPELRQLLEAEERRLRGQEPAAWARGAALRRRAKI